MWLFGGIITLSKIWVNIAAAKNATARNVSLPTLTRSCFTGVGIAKTLPGPTRWVVPSSMCSSPVPAMMYCVSSVASVCQRSRFPGSISYTIVEDAVEPCPPYTAKAPVQRTDSSSSAQTSARLSLSDATTGFMEPRLGFGHAYVKNGDAGAPKEVSGDMLSGLQQPFGEQFGHVLGPRVCQIDNLMPAACAGRDDFCARRLTIDLIDQVCGHLDGEVVFLSERAKRARHSAAAGI